MAANEKSRRSRRPEFNVKTFLIAVVVIGVLVGVALWILVAVRGRQLLPKPPNPTPHARPVGAVTSGRLLA
jgi:hypothetical protein